jgi:hypothetical protein
MLQNSCSCNETSVYPNNWMTGGKALLKMNWYIQYYFPVQNFNATVSPAFKLIFCVFV